jgi:predicted naringenin-chalcone synthase
MAALVSLLLNSATSSHSPTAVAAVINFRLQVCFTAVRDVLAKTGVHPRQIGCVIVNCSLFNPTPSLSAMIMNHFKMSSNVCNYNLGGMGCSGAYPAITLHAAVMNGLSQVGIWHASVK